MKPSPLPLLSFRSTSARRDGVALIIVLSVLVLLTILVVGFLSRVGMERTSASAYFDGSRNRALADQAVDIVRAQIDHAASRPWATWASQPGMVRAYGYNQTLLHAYKLYSDDEMVSTSVDAADAVASLNGWETRPAFFVDLNAPVRIDGQAHFPILNPSALDRNEDGAPLIEGFSVTSAPGADSAQPIPMPVRWLYVLEDGQVVAPTGAGTQEVEIPGATAANPIVGRIAFWADDETSKLNINTAAHGRFWDIPRAFARDERDRMARFQPALREFQRYPGHPATTSLWPVLGYKVNQEAEFDAWVAELTPRIAYGGSRGGTVFQGAEPVTLDDDRLYSSVDELLFSATNGAREPRGDFTRSDIERVRFFLTARSNNPEVNLFKEPRIALWPVNSGSKSPSTLDRLVAFCATINGGKYYIQREAADSPSADLEIDPQATSGKGRNEVLFDYLLNLLERPFPGFADESIVEKYTRPEVRQIVTMMIDYIRSSNLYSSAHGATPFTGTGADPLGSIGSGAGQVAPLRIGETKGFGRLPAISQAVFHLYASGLRSEAGTFPSAAFPMATGRTPFYSEGFDAPAYSNLRSFLDTTGANRDISLLTSAIIYFDTFDPNLGYARPRYNYAIDVEFSGEWEVNGQKLGFQNSTITINRDQLLLYNAKNNGWASTYYGRFYGGHLGPLWMMQNYTFLAGNTPNAASQTPRSELAYPLSSQRLALHLPFRLINENAGKLGGDGLPLPAKLTFPPSTTLATGESGGAPVDEVRFSGGQVKATVRVGTETVQTYTFNFPAYVKPSPTFAPRGYLINMPAVAQSDEDVVLKQFATSADFRHRWTQQPFNNKKQIGGGHLGGHSADVCDVWLLQGMDTVVALEPVSGDKRNIAALADVPADRFVPHRDYAATTVKIAADFRNDPSGADRRTRARERGERPGRILDIYYGANAMPDVPSRYPNGVATTTQGGFWPDFDNGTLHTPDDAYINRADEGSANTSISDDLLDSQTGSRSFSWYGETAGSINNALFFSPNKQMPSAGMFGSLPTGVVRNHPWQTLLFRPDPGGGSGHPGAKSPEDFLWLDLFWMPVVEPYAISEPFSSNGKVNLNYQIMPFGYIHRSSALRGVLHRQEMVVLDDAMAYSGNRHVPTGYSSSAPGDEYKKYSFNDLATSLSSRVIRKRLNLDQATGTLRTLEDRFATNKLFISEAEICTIPLIPEGESWSADFEQEYWANRRLTGDNSREVPYTHLLPRLTTRSNTYSVHFRVQSVRQVPSSTPGQWNETRDRVLAEYRGRRTIERYIDPNDPNIPDYGANPGALPTLDAFYRWRVLHNETFAP